MLLWSPENQSTAYILARVTGQGQQARTSFSYNKVVCGCSRVQNPQAPKGHGGVQGHQAARVPQDIMRATWLKYYTTRRGSVQGNTSKILYNHAGFPSRRATSSAPKGEIDELSGRTTGRLGYIGPTMLREYVGRTTSRTTGRATCCTMDHATDRATQRCTPDQQPLLRHRAVGPADVQRWIHTYGDRGPAPLVRRK